MGRSELQVLCVTSELRLSLLELFALVSGGEGRLLVDRVKSDSEGLSSTSRSIQIEPRFPVIGLDLIDPDRLGGRLVERGR